VYTHFQFLSVQDIDVYVFKSGLSLQFDAKTQVTKKITITLLDANKEIILGINADKYVYMQYTDTRIQVKVIKLR
jgi:hypothetical protein